MIEMNAMTLSRALKNGLVFVSRDNYRPILTELRVEYGSDEMTFIGTDSYVMGIQRVPVDSVEGEGVFHWTTPLARLALYALSSIHPRNRKGITVQITPKEDEVEVVVDSLVLRGPNGTIARYPGWRNLYDSKPTRATTKSGLNPTILKRLCGVVDLVTGANASLVIESDMSMAPCRFSVGTTVDILLMPVRIT